MFYKTYYENVPNNSDIKIVEVGSCGVHQHLRSLAPKQARYIGTDLIQGPGVDILCDDPYILPFEDQSVDIVISSSCFEHSEMFWLTYLEIIRILKPHGLFYLNVPSNGYFHRYPVDCWRFYPDSGNALVSWAKRNNYNSALLESYVSERYFNNLDEVWEDYVAIFVKDKSFVHNYPKRILSSIKNFRNGITYESKNIINQAK